MSQAVARKRKKDANGVDDYDIPRRVQLLPTLNNSFNIPIETSDETNDDKIEELEGMFQSILDKISDRQKIDITLIEWSTIQKFRINKSRAWTTTLCSKKTQSSYRYSSFMNCTITIIEQTPNIIKILYIFSSIFNTKTKCKCIFCMTRID